MAKKRNENIQWFRGVGIIAIVLYHFPMFYKLEFIDYIQRFVRLGQANELFFVMAGYFLAAKCLHTGWDMGSVIEFIKSRTRRFIIPLSVWGGQQPALAY